MADVVEINCQTGEITERDYTPEEILDRENAAKVWAEELARREAEAAAKASAEAKLAALGLTPEEIAALR